MSRLTAIEQDHYDELDRRATNGEMKPGKLSAVPRAGAAYLMEITGTDNVEDAHRIVFGRPRLGETRGASPVVKFRVTQELKEGMQQRAEHLGISLSEVWRKAGERYLSAR